MLRSLLNRINPFSKAPHLAVVFVEYDRAQEKSAAQTFAILQQYLSALYGCRITYLRVDNKDESKPLTKTASNIFTVGGDNSSHEFSGWQRGITVLASLHCHYDLLLIVNDMFLKPGPSFLQDYATPELLKKSLSEKKIIGRIDSTGQNYTLFGHDVSSWICTNCFLVPREAANALGNMVLINNNIHQIFPHRYNPHHLIKREHLPIESISGNFYLECDLPAGHDHEIRIRFDTAMAGQELHLSNAGRPHTAMINQITINNQSIPEEHHIRGLFQEQGVLWAEQSFLLDLPQDDAHPSRLIIKGCLPPAILQESITNEFGIVVYNDAMLFQENAPINTTYQRWIVEWLTERWHSRFEINQDTWGLFKSKASAIFNESLLTAKFSELGYPPETYGQKNYY